MKRYKQTKHIGGTIVDAESVSTDRQANSQTNGITTQVRGAIIRCFG